MLVKDYYDKRYAKNNRNKPRKTVMRFVDKYLKKGDKCLDLGCGEGRNTEYMYSRGMDVIGVDLSDEGVKQTNKRIGKQVATTDTTFDFKDGEFKGIVCNRMIEYGDTVDVDVRFKEISRLLCKHGVALITTRSVEQKPGHGEVLVQANDLGGRDYKDYAYEDMVQHYFSAEEITFLADKADLDIIEMEQRETKREEGKKVEWVIILEKL